MLVAEHLRYNHTKDVTWQGFAAEGGGDKKCRVTMLISWLVESVERQIQFDLPPEVSRDIFGLRDLPGVYVLLCSIMPRKQ